MLKVDGNIDNSSNNRNDDNDGNNDDDNDNDNAEVEDGSDQSRCENFDSS